MLGGPKSGKESQLTDDETIEKCLTEVEAALTAGLNFKGKFNSGLQVCSSTFLRRNTALRHLTDCLGP